MKQVTRRRFLGVIGAAAVTAGAPIWLKAGVLPIRKSAAQDENGDKTTYQWGMIIDLRKCDGCDSYSPGEAQCTTACQREHGLREEQAWIRVFKMEEAEGGAYYMPRPCFHCENAPCLNVCPVGATFRNEEGAVLVDQDRCIGCRFCMAACPYGARYFNWDEPLDSSKMALSDPTPEYPVPQRRGTVGKCEGCVHDLRYGRLPSCVEACPMNAVYSVDLTKDLATNGIEVVQASRFIADGHGYRFKEELGTKPRVVYIPGHGQEFGRSPES